MESAQGVPARRSKPRYLAVLAIALAVPAAGAGTGGANEHGSALDAALRVLRFGSVEERREVATGAQELFRALRHVDPGGRRAGRIVESLLDVLLERERDEWNLFLLTRALARVGTYVLDPLFAELLDHPSPNVRRSAAMHFSSRNGGDAIAAKLDRAWRREEHLRVRQALLEALTFHRRDVHAEDMLELIWADDPAVAHTAIVELSDLRPAGALQALARRAREGPPWLRQEALTNVLEWKGSAEAVAIYAEHLAGEDPLLRNFAARQLRWFEHPDAVRLMTRLVRDPASDLCVRRAIAAGLDPEAPGAEEALLRVLAEPTTPDNADVQRAAAVRLARAGLSAIAPDSLPNERRHHECRWDAPRGGWRIAPPDSWATVRCWQEPGRRVPSDRESRLPRGREIFPQDHFASDGRSYMLDASGCWIEAPYVVAADGASETAADEVARPELEATPREAELPRIRELLDRGWIEIRDRTDVAVALAVVVEDAGEPGEEPIRMLRSALPAAPGR